MDTPVTDLLHLNALPSNPDSTLSSFAVTHAPPDLINSNLGLDEWVKSNGGKIVQMPPSPSPLPSSLTSSTSQSMVSETPKMHAESLSKLLNNLESTMEFRIHGLPGGTVLYFLVGQLSERTGGFSPEDGYAGLVGVGVMADGDEE
ncbi:hypothetical protein FS842_005168 [Serendipita sp. 407]|nr:hypothetical protein FS842_005168 [Serendipita sp. 407]